MADDSHIKLKVILAPPTPRTVFKQKDAGVPVFDGGDVMEPDCQCGLCGTVLVKGVMIREVPPDAVRLLPMPEGGEEWVLSVSVPAGQYIQSQGGRMVVKCAACGSFNELVPSDVIE